MAGPPSQPEDPCPMILPRTGTRRHSGSAHLSHVPSLRSSGYIVNPRHRYFKWWHSARRTSGSSSAPLGLPRHLVELLYLLLLDPIRQSVQVAVVHQHSDEGEPEIPVAQVERLALRSRQAHDHFGTGDCDFLRGLRFCSLAGQVYFRLLLL